MTLLEVVIAQTLVLLVVTGMIALVAQMTRKLHAETSVSDAQVHLREATHLLLRDTQALGGDHNNVGDWVFVTDGGVRGSDQLKLFKRDEGLCGGTLKVERTGSGSIEFQAVPSSPCPITPGNTGGCSEGELSGTALQVHGADQLIVLVPTQVESSSCKINFPSGSNVYGLAEYNATYGRTYGNLNRAFDEIDAHEIYIGTDFTYRVNNETLQRSQNGGPFVDIVDRVADLQIERLYDIDADSDIDAGEVITATSGTALPIGASNANFMGIRIGLVTFGRSPDAMQVRPPALFSNRDTSLLPTERRYRDSFVVAAARNR